ncbi:histidine triad nucleotide-binding protein [Pelodictyon luteolum]|uniref:Hit family protein n=1 Tax=Chlorobium luteolum (strain DSM 273 / BCRC 81028 / 2530) TaxID=319225 RepID=Q3B163_CHLL3|nr:histidine triad nucleotide-binding protein [Pelodictyon luteolum]ABB24918.1 Hit family protein [Pelodictyon luteolum DSM 273]
MENHSADCIFCRIIAGEIPADILYRNDHVLAFRDISPVAPAHALIIPLEHIASLSDLSPDHLHIAGQIMLAAGRVADILGVRQSGYRFVFNSGPDALQSVFHIHGHLLGGTGMGWPPFPGAAITHGA